MITEDNFMVFAMKMYENPQCKDIEEFHEDLNRIKYLKRLFKKYKASGVIVTGKQIGRASCRERV